jgi:hypothetical protein
MFRTRALQAKLHELALSARARRIGLMLWLAVCSQREPKRRLSGRLLKSAGLSNVPLRQNTSNFGQGK